ncbi:PAL-domain-containing protein [Pseudovirgaria hyperparasitica]|uniref:PAL-domain-containing protein n=1 Tax=Pseudovirgaria hyperparasitica TaxID=470096 RepID=A0A6A6W7S0_9PEZI|nr:PAL-domain-containing protein [Pseudovirgaria hyperparasitica]KAF2758585.1 PAL-domain-containing protein [Pseudovirgaria hyperparasitica]
MSTARTNTGLRGSVNSRTGETIQLQAALLQLTQAGVGNQSPDGSKPVQAMPSDWLRATIAVRCNKTLRGHTAVSLPVLEAMACLLKHQIAPVFLLRGSVFVSGDLMPLSYIVGAIEGNPDIRVEMAQSSGQTILCA